MLFASVIPASTILPGVMQLMRGPCPPFESITQPEPVTVHWLVGVRCPPYSSGKRYCRSAVQKCEPVSAAAVLKPPPSISSAARHSASAIVEHAPYSPR